MALRVIARGVSVNVGMATMNRDIISGDGDAILVASFAGGSDLDRLIFWRLDINGAAPSSRKKKKKKNRCPRSHAAPEGIAGRKCCKGEKVRAASGSEEPTARRGLAFTYSPEKQGDHVRVKSAPQSVD